ncbi:MAG: DNA topoisomerase I [Candidatus Woesearchaeota archaeon]
MVELIITEKPAASKKLAEALADGKPTKKSEKGVPYYELTHKKKEILIGCAVGHLFTVAEKVKHGFKYPTFDLEWKPSYEESKGSDFSKKYFDVLKKISKNADSFTVACDYDVEGEVIGLNIIRYICKQKDASRMKFSTLTKPDLVNAYASKSKSLDWGQAFAGETRHYLDYYYGINMSRALTSAIKSSGVFKILSIGRVQGPALKIIVDREHDISAFKPVPFWQIMLLCSSKGSDFSASHQEDKFWDKSRADQVFAKVKDARNAIVSKVETARFNQQPPFPFDLTSLQLECYRCFRIEPKETLEHAQNLYTEGLISYPRTSSQELPPAIGFQKIFNALSKQKPYSVLAMQLKPVTPNNGKKTDPAHPAIYPTGLAPKSLKEREAKVYDIIVKRFLSTFAAPAVRETMTISIDLNGEPFLAKGTTTVEKGWHLFYEPYVKLDETELPLVNAKDVLDVKKVDFVSKETQPPNRYNPSSMIKELEKKGLGTKATRAQIVDTLFQRGYVQGSPIQATELGIQTVDTLLKYIPEILDEELTRHFDEEMEDIREKKRNEPEILEEAKSVLTKILENFKKKESVIGQELSAANRESIRLATTVGKCPKCNGDLIIRKGKFGRFIACNKYPECSTTYKLPATGLVKVSDKVCDTCKMPIVIMIRKAKKPQEVCINPDCASKGVPADFKERPCPKCKEGTLILRKSVYGAFIACNRFPKCRYTERIKHEADVISTKNK